MAISNASNQIVKVNLIPGIIPSVLHLSQYDTGAGRPITFSVYDGSQAFTIPSGVSIAFEGTKPDGNGFSFTCSKSGNNALLTNYTNQMTALPGKIMCQLVFTNTSGGRVGSLPVLMVVSPAGINEDTVISDSDIEAIIAAQNAYAALNARLDATIDQVNTTTNKAIDQMNTTTNKAIDQMNTKANDLQNQYAVTNAKLDTAISAATQDSEVQDIRVKADGTSAATAGNAVREQFTELKNDLGLIPFEFTDGAFVQFNNQLYDHNNYCYSTYIDVKPGDKIFLYCHFHDNPRAVFVNDRKSVVIQAIANTGATTEYSNILTVPDGARYFRFSCLINKKDKTYIGYIINNKLNNVLLQNYNFENRLNKVETIESAITLSFTDGGFINANNNIEQSATYSYTDYIPVLEGQRIKIVSNFYDNARILFVNSDYVKVQALNNAGAYPEYDETITVPESSAYVRFSCKTSYKETAEFKYIEQDYLKRQAEENYVIFDLSNMLVQGNETNPNNKNRVVLFVGNKEGKISVKVKPGYQYYFAEYDSPFYDNQVSSSGFKQVSAQYDVISTRYSVIVFSRTNYSAVSPSDVISAGNSITFLDVKNDYAQENTRKVYEIKEVIEQNGLTEQLIVPRIYDNTNYIGGKIEQINNEVKKVFGSGDAFVFITDLHWKLNRKHSMSLLNRIYSLTHIDKLFVGGDISDSKNSDDSYFEAGSIIRNSWPGKTYYVMGNHEYLGRGSDGITTDDNLAYDFGAYYGNEVVYGNKKRNYYYVDNGGSKIRYIFLNRYAESVDNGQSSSEGLEEAQLNWFENVALNVENGWSVIIVLHSVFGFNIVEDNVITPFISTGSQGLVRIIENYNGQGEIIAIITGHAHLDAVFRLSNNIPVIVTTCDKNKSGGERMFDPDYWTNRADGTLNEQAFDVMFVDKEARKITAVRIGCPATTWTESDANLIRGSDVEERVITF